MELIVEIIGIIGVIIVMSSYFFLQTEHISSQGTLYPFLNLIGSVMILASMYYEWNFPAFLMEFSWALISMFGMYKNNKAKKR